MMYTIEEAKEKYRRAVELGLSGAELLADPEAVRRDCNGIGAEWMGEHLRDIVGALNPTLVLAADIHDRRYAVGGDSEARARADREFLENGMILADARYGWYDPRRYIVRNNARKFYAALRAVGGAAWNWEGMTA